MCYAFVQLFPDYPAASYWRVVDELGTEPFEGLLVHLAGPYEGGWRILQVWRSADDYARFARGRLWSAISSSNGMQGVSPPELEWLEFDHVIVGTQNIRRNRDE